MAYIPNSGEQLPLQFHQYEALNFQQFIAGNNKQAIESLQNQIKAEAEQIKPVYLWGAPGTGKSHLLQAACEQAHTAELSVAYVPLKLIIENDPQHLQGLEQLELVCIDDLHLVKQNLMWQEAIFHLFNRIKNHKHRLFMSSIDNPIHAKIELADLKSRLSWGLTFRLEDLNDAEKIQVMKQQANRRGFELTDEVTTYLLNNVDRNLTNLLRLLDSIDQGSLAKQRKITIPFVKSLLT